MPVTTSITAPSTGGVSNSKVPPISPVIFAVPPSHEGAIVKEESSSIIVVTAERVVVGHPPLVV